MALLNQEFRYSGIQSLSINDDPENLLDDIADWLNNATQYYDAASRTAGAGSAWTATKEVSGVTVAARLQPPTTSGAPDQRVMLAAVGSGSPTPPMFASDTFGVDRLLMGHVRGPVLLDCVTKQPAACQANQDAHAHADGDLGQGGNDPVTAHISQFFQDQSDKESNQWRGDTIVESAFHVQRPADAHRYARVVEDWQP